MKKTLLLLLLINFSFAKYLVYYQGIKLGEAENLDCIKNNYLEAKVTNSIARFLLGKDIFVFYNDEYKGKFNPNTKYKKDNRAIIYLLKKATQNNIKDKERVVFKKDKYIDVIKQKNKNEYKFVYYSNGRIKSKGYFIIKNNQLQILKEETNHIEISKNS